MKKQSKWRMALAVCIFAIVTINLFMAIQLSRDVRKLQLLPQKKQPLLCGAIPTRFVIEEPVCANKLLESMNVSNIHILPAWQLDSLLNKTAIRLQNLSKENK